MSEEAVINYSTDIVVKVRHNQEVFVELAQQGPQGPQGEKGPKGDITPELDTARNQAVFAAQEAAASKEAASAFAVDANDAKEAAAVSAQVSAISAGESGNARNVALSVERDVKALEANALLVAEQIGDMRDDVQAERLLAVQAKSVAESARDQANTAFSNTNAARADVFDARDAAQSARDRAQAALTAIESVRDEAVVIRRDAAESAAAAAKSAIEAAKFDPSSYTAKANNGSDFADPAAVRANIGAAAAVELVTKAEAEAGASQVVRDWTSQRVREAVAAYAPAKSHNHTIGNISGLQAALDAKAALASPVFTGTPKVPTPEAGNRSTQIASTEYVRNALDELIGSAPGTLDTLQEIADAIGDDPNFAATMTQQLAGKAATGHGHEVSEIAGLEAALNDKAALASPALSGTPTAPTAGAEANSTQLATTAHVKLAIAASGMATSGHKHAIGDVTDLQAALDGKAASGHTHVAADITDLAALLNAKAPLASPTFTGSVIVPTPAVGDSSTKAANTSWVATSLANALSGKANSSHGHAVSDISGLQTALDGKAPSAHDHVVANIAGLQDALDAKLGLAGGTLTGALVLPASTASGAGFRLQQGVAPTSPVNGDMWSTTGGFAGRVNGSSRTLWDSINLPQMSSADAQAGVATNARTISAATLRAGIAAAPVSAAMQAALDAKLNLAGGDMTGSLGLAGVGGGAGGNGFKYGTADGASYTDHNFILKGWWGIGMASYDDSINGYYDFRQGKWDTKGGFFKNGVEMLSKAGGDISGNLGITGSAGNDRLVAFKTSGVMRMAMFINAQAESGNNAGSNFAIARYADNGDYIDSPIFLERATGRITLTANINLAGVNFGSNAIGAINDLSKHISLYGANEYGFSVSSGALNVISGGSFQWANGTTIRMTLTSAGDLTASGNVTAYSDERLKSDIRTIENALDMVSSMRGVRFTMNGRRGLGVVAQEFQKIAPELVIEADDQNRTLSVAYGNTVGILIEAIKELHAKVEELEGRAA